MKVGSALLIAQCKITRARRTRIRRRTPDDCFTAVQRDTEGCSRMSVLHVHEYAHYLETWATSASRAKESGEMVARTMGNMPILRDAFYCRDKRPCCPPSLAGKPAKRYECNLYFCALMDIFSPAPRVLRARRSSHSLRLTEGAFFMVAEEKKRDKPVDRPRPMYESWLREKMTLEISATSRHFARLSR